MLTILTTLALAAAPQQEVDPVGSLQTLDVPLSPGAGPVLIDVEIAGRDVVLELERHSLRAGDFKLLVSAPDGRLVEMPAPAPNTWRGVASGLDGATVTATINDQGLTAIVDHGAAGIEWQIQPAAGHPSGTYSVARAEDLIIPPGTCGVPDGSPAQPGPPISFLGTGLQLCELALDSDYEFYLDNGSSVGNTVDDMERIINRVDDIYVRDADVTFLIGTIVVRSNSNDPYTTSNAGDLLDQFAFQWQNNFGFVQRDLAHMFTGRALNGGTIGVAFLSQVCSSGLGYGLSERFTTNLVARTGLTAHEIGHNFSAQHCNGSSNCRIMCATLGGCSNDVTQFAPAVANGIRSYAIGRPCLLDLADPLTLPVTDLVGTTIDRDIWISEQNVQVSTNAVNEPSGTRSYRLNAANSGTYADDYLVSNKVLLGGLTDVDLTFYSQARGVQAGNSIRLDYLDSFGNWNLLQRITSNGTTENSFTFRQYSLPSGALHDDVQFRFVAEVDSSGESWYLDDIEITDQFCGTVVSTCIPTTNSTGNVGTLSLFGTTVVPDNSVAFFASGLPVGQFGLLVYGDSTTIVPLGDGFLCVNGSPIYRYSITQIDNFGTTTIPFDLTNLPPGSVINPGDLVYFQYWHRDGTPGGANLTDALAVEFCP